MPDPTGPAVVLLSGGLDSCVAAAHAASRGHVLHALTIDYGQRHRAELAAAARVASALRVATHRTVAIDLRAIGGSALTAEIDVPKDRPAESMAAAAPVTYVPARNTIFLAVALALAETVGAPSIVIGANALDYSGYPDCRDGFLRAFERVANAGTVAGTSGTEFTIDAPLLRMSKAEIVRLGADLGAPLALTHSCYDPVGAAALACGRCDSCILRRNGFAAAGVADPTRYAGEAC